MEKNELGYQEPGGDEEGARRRLDRLDGCLMWGVGLPGVVLVVAGMTVAIWGSETVGRSVLWLKVGATVMLGVLVVVGIGAVFRVRRGK